MLKFEGFQYITFFDLNIDYYHIELNLSSGIYGLLYYLVWLLELYAQ